MLPILRTATRSDSAAFFWLDKEGRIENLYSERLPASLRASSGSEAASLQPWQGARCANQEVITSTIETEAHARGWYGEILRINRAQHILHGVPVRNGAAVGRLSLFREGGLAFGMYEAAEVSDIIRYVASAISDCDVGRPESPWDGEEDVLEQEVIVADRHGHVIHATEGARRLLLLATGCRIAPDTMDEARSASEALVQALSRRDSAAGGRPRHHGQITRDTMWGRFVLRSYPLRDRMDADNALLGVHIRHIQPKWLRLVCTMSALPLSPQQCEIAGLIVRGGTNREIAEQLAVSLNTVAYHIKQLFLKLDVHDRSELLAKLRAHGVEAETA